MVELEFARGNGDWGQQALPTERTPQGVTPERRQGGHGGKEMGVSSMR